jgi:hypothetical protein
MFDKARSVMKNVGMEEYTKTQVQHNYAGEC